LSLSKNEGGSRFDGLTRPLSAPLAAGNISI
jgi:hypothetical protein